ncbi:hypothetical protein [Amycolatopsis pigmentata]|uniref:Luciferase-like monooxygenase n=1 Tax=Amycolatopsis pigmentata TaxID=450801 RepID=A0ABW5G4J9_9PSEU
MPHAELLGDLVYDGDWRGFDLGYGRIARLIDNLRGHYLGDEHTVIHSPGNTQRPRLQPHVPGLVDRTWYGGGSLRSIRWAAEEGLNLLTGNVISGEGTDDFVTAQRTLIGEYRRLIKPDRPARIALGRVIVPFDSADTRTRARYRAYAASRHRPHPETARTEANPVRAGHGGHLRTDPRTALSRCRRTGSRRTPPRTAVRVRPARLPANPP